MPKVAYSDEEREQIRQALVTTALDLMARQGIQHTTVEQIYKAFARRLMDDPTLSWRDAVSQFLHACCYGERNGIAILTVEEQQLLFRRLSPESYRIFREKQGRLFGNVLECFGIKADTERVQLFTNLCLTAVIVRRAIPGTLPLFVPEAADATVEFQIKAIVDCLESLRIDPLP